MSKSLQKIDRGQVRAMISVSLKNDWRGSSNPMTGGSSRKSKFPGIMIILIMNVIMSIFLGAIFIPVSDLFTGMVLAATGAMILVAVQVLLEFGNVIISPDDYHVIGPHPVSSRTFYTAKMVHLLIYVTVLSATVSIAPAIFAAFNAGTVWAAPVVLLHFWVISVFATFLVMNLYTLILKKVDRRRLERVLGYVHMGLNIGFYLGINVLTRVMKNVLIGFDIDTMPWMKALPAYWFAGWVRLGFSGWDWEIFLIALSGLAILIGMGRMAFSYLSLSYAESLTRTAWTRTSKARPTIPPLLRKLWYGLSNYEDRALLTLVRANFKHDTQFRLGILAFIPLLLIYMIYGFVTAGSNVRNPLAPEPETQVITNILLGLAVVILPHMILSIMQTSKSWRAAWVFYATPLDRVKLIQAMDRIIMALIVLPIGLLMCGMFAYLYGNLVHAVLHSVFMILMTVTGLTFLNIFSIRLPFATDSRPGNQLGSTFGPMLASGALFGIPIAIIANVGYGGYLGYAIILAATLLLKWLLGRGRVHRIRRVAATWEFTG